VLTIALAGAIAICAQSGDSPPSDAERRQALKSLSRVAPNVRWDINSLVVGDIACDGRSDQVYFGHAGDKIYVGLFRSRDKKPQVLEFRVGSGYQDAICKEPAELAIESLDYDLDYEVKGFQRSNVCKGLVLNDDACDPIHFFWNHSTRQLNWWRN